MVSTAFVLDVSISKANGDSAELIFWHPVLLFGINDCAKTADDALEPIVGKLFAAVRALREEGAKNFLLLDVPPIDRSPGGTVGYINGMHFK
jgi:hypothetical protein